MLKTRLVIKALVIVALSLACAVQAVAGCDSRPNPPFSLRAVPNGANNIELQWSGSGTQFYDIYISDSTGHSVAEVTCPVSSDHRLLDSAR